MSHFLMRDLAFDLNQSRNSDLGFFFEVCQTILEGSRAYNIAKNHEASPC